MLLFLLLLEAGICDPVITSSETQTTPSLLTQSSRDTTESTNTPTSNTSTTNVTNSPDIRSRPPPISPNPNVKGICIDYFVWMRCLLG